MFVMGYEKLSLEQYLLQLLQAELCNDVKLRFAGATDKAGSRDIQVG